MSTKGLRRTEGAIRSLEILRPPPGSMSPKWHRPAPLCHLRSSFTFRKSMLYLWQGQLWREEVRVSRVWWGSSALSQKLWSRESAPGSLGMVPPRVERPSVGDLPSCVQSAWGARSPLERCCVGSQQTRQQALLLWLMDMGILMCPGVMES